MLSERAVETYSHDGTLKSTMHHECHQAGILDEFDRTGNLQTQLCYWAMLDPTEDAAGRVLAELRKVEAKVEEFNRRVWLGIPSKSLMVESDRGGPLKVEGSVVEILVLATAGRVMITVQGDGLTFASMVAEDVVVETPRMSLQGLWGSSSEVVALLDGAIALWEGGGVAKRDRKVRFF